MPTKKELLEEKTVEELRQMARDKNLSGYSNLKKSGLIGLIEENYLKKEIRKWPYLGIEQVGGGEDFQEEDSSGNEVPKEELEIDKKVPKGPDMVFVSVVLGAVVAGAVAVVFLVLSHI